MTTPTIISAVPTRIFERADYNLEIETTLMLEKYEEQLKNDGKKEENRKPIMQQIKQVARATNINNPEAVKEWLASEECHWNPKTKTKFCYNYTGLLNFLQIKWTPPHYQIIDKIPFIPTEQEIDLLISACGKVTSTALQMLKETGVRIGELTQLKWTDIDFERKTVNVTPEKNSNGRILPISDKLIGMLDTLSKQHAPNVFQPDKKMLREYFAVQRNEIAEKLSNPRLKEIHFHSLRHWKGTMEYHKTKDIMHVRYVLGHKNINCTLIYINIEETLYLQNTDEWITKVSHNLDEETQLINAGFQLVRSVNETTAIYKKRK